MIFSNVIEKEKIREIQLEVLELLANSLKRSFGPMGSNTMITKRGMLNKYTKDGWSILQDIYLKGVFESAVVSDIKDIVRNVIVEFGDNSTSAIILCYLLYKELVKLEETSNSTPYEIINNFKEAVDNISKRILKNGKECTLEDIYNISYTATNGNEEIAEMLRAVYEKYGMNVFIDVSCSVSKDTLVKEYDGLTLRSGYADSAYVTDSKKNIASVPNPRIYVFDDSIDTPGMIALFDAIISKNIYTPLMSKPVGKVIPTVILCKKISRDMSGIIKSLVETMQNMPEGNKIPFLMVANITDDEELDDIAMLCGCPHIKRYINKEVYEADVKAGKAPTVQNVETYYGTCELVESDTMTTRIKSPKKMLEKDGSRSQTYNSLVENLEGQLRKWKEEGQDVSDVGRLKRRINSLKANMVEIFVGGIATADRDSLRDLVEDAVLNCRSAAMNGVGAAANFEGYWAARDLYLNDVYDQSVVGDKSYLKGYYKCIMNAYYDIIEILIKTCLKSSTSDDIGMIVDKSLNEKKAYNLRTNSFDGLILTSIKSDVASLEAISRILTIMLTCNQVLLEDPVMSAPYLDNQFNNAIK